MHAWRVSHGELNTCTILVREARWRRRLLSADMAAVDIHPRLSNAGFAAIWRSWRAAWQVTGHPRAPTTVAFCTPTSAELRPAKIDTRRLWRDLAFRPTTWSGDSVRRFVADKAVIGSTPASMERDPISARRLGVVEGRSRLVFSSLSAFSFAMASAMPPLTSAKLGFDRPSSSGSLKYTAPSRPFAAIR